MFSCPARLNFNYNTKQSTILFISVVWVLLFFCYKDQQLLHEYDTIPIDTISLHSNDRKMLEKQILNMTTNINFNYSLYLRINTQSLSLFKRKMDIFDEFQELTDEQPLHEYFHSYYTNGSSNSIMVSNEFYLSIKHCLIYCGIFKVGSTKLNQLLLYYIKNKQMYTQIHAALAVSLSRMHSVNQLYNALAFANRTLIKFVFLRDPLKRLLSGFINECLNRPFRESFNIFCKKLYSIQDKNLYFNQKNEKMVPYFRNNISFTTQLFKQWIDVLYSYDNMKINTINNAGIKNINDWPNEHFMPQVYWCNLYQFINLYDYIVIYDKTTFETNVKYVFDRIIKNDVTNTYSNMMVNREVDKLFNTWGDSKNESLFRRKYSWNRNVKSYDDEMTLLKIYYTRSLAIRALYLYKFDYQYLPIDPPLWITTLDN